MIPKDPVMLLSFINLKLRDYFDSLERLCEELDVEQREIVDKLFGIGYQYDQGKNQFVSVGIQ
ncbi:MAG: DUF4250 domain-containing protein [Lachnospiraceae bacterium]